ncbi:hypothetical protein BGZ90_007308 [Linnemannia elongata]|nr:hypothetical protein BGZ90_007308 [Linnemannia elongata]
MDWYMMAANQGYAYAQYCIGNLYGRGRGVQQDYDKAMEWYLRAGNQGLPAAQFNIGYMCLTGRGVAPDEAVALSWLSKAVSRKDVDVWSQFAMGYMCCNGLGVPKSESTAFPWLLKAARQGFPDAQYLVGSMYLNGFGVSQDCSKGLSWLIKSANHNNSDAQHEVGSMYLHGQGVPKNYLTAKEWLTKAVKFGCGEAKASLSEVQRLLDKDARPNGTLAGYANHQTLRTDFETMSLDTFLDTHVYHGSRKDGKSVPPFYLPVETPSGPDVVFVLHLDNHGYCSVFVQLKCRREMTRTKGQSSFSTAESDEAQGHLQETMLQKYCTGHPKRFLGVVIAYPFEFAGVESTFPEIRRNGRILHIQGHALQCISLSMDKNNFHDLCLKNHTQALDLLKENKRQLDQIDGGQGRDDQKDEPATKLRRCEDEDKDSRVDS